MVFEVCGGVGSGKSLVLAYLREDYGACITSMDELAHELYRPGQPNCHHALELMGEKILAENGQLDRSVMADCLCQGPSLLSLLDEAVHPLVYDRVEVLAQSKKERFLAVETALPAREHSHIYNEIWYAFTPRDLRIQRLMVSRGCTRECVAEIMEEQLSDAAYAGMTDWTLVDDADEANLYRRIDTRLAGKEFR